MCEVLGAPSPEERVEQGGKKRKEEKRKEEKRKEEKRRGKGRKKERRKDQSSEVGNSSFQTLYLLGEILFSLWDRDHFASLHEA